MNQNVVIIGAGNIGSRHLQGLKKVAFPLTITIIDTSDDSLKIAEERWLQIPSKTKHSISFTNKMELLPKDTDLAIIATSSHIRRKVLEELISKTKVKNLILEKLLFQKKEDYSDVETLLKSKKIKTWVNCSMRVTPFYSDIKSKLESKILHCVVDGSQYGFVTNLIHFLDYIAFLSDCYEFTLDTELLNKKPIKSKREGYLEFQGTVTASFKNGSTGLFSCYANGDAPVVVEIFSPNLKGIADETNRTVLISQNPKWNLQPSKKSLAFQSDLTNIVATDILKKGSCDLTPYHLSAKIHLTLLETFKKHLNKYSSKKYNYYPFT